MATTSTTVQEADHEPVEWTLGERIRKCHKLLGLEQDAFGKKFGVSGSLVSKWEKDQREPKFSQVRAIELASPVPEGFLLRSRCSDIPALRVIPGGAKSSEIAGQGLLQHLVLVES